MKKIKWPNNAKMAVTLSFDVDAESGWIQDEKNRKRLSLLSASAFGRRVGIERILSLLNKFGIKGQFYIPGYTAEIDEALVRKVNQNGHLIGCHGYYHERTDTLSYEKEDQILQRSKEKLEKLTGKIPMGYRAPLWEATPQTLDLIQKHHFLYDSSLMGNDVPYVVPVNNYKLLELPVAWMLDDWEQFFYSAEPLNGLAIEETTKVLRLWKQEFAALYEEGRYFLLTMHPEVIGRASRIKMVEELVSYMKSYEGVWFCTPKDIYDAWKSGELELEEYPY